MKIEFDSIEQKTIPNFKGGQGNTIANMYVDSSIKIMHGKLEGGATIGMHKHDTSSEIIYILSGNAKCLYDDTVEYLKPGEAHYCPKGHAHSLQNASDTEKLVFFAVVPNANF